MATPTGAVRLWDNNNPTMLSGTLDGNGQATIQDASLAVGTHSITFAYTGDANFNPSTSAPLTIIIDPIPVKQNTTTTATADQNEVQQGVPINFSISVVGS